MSVDRPTDFFYGDFMLMHLHRRAALAVLVCGIAGYASSASADSIQMLPPVKFGTAASCSDQPATPGMLFWDGVNPIVCVPNFVGTSQGFVGIGNAEPDYNLDVGGAGAAGFASRLGGMSILTADAGYEWWTGSFTARGPWQLTHRQISDGAWTNAITVLPGGPVGIGTAAPSAPLDVNGGIRGSNSSLVVAGGGCSPEGMFGYDLNGHQPVYCGVGSAWMPITGGSLGPVTWGPWQQIALNYPGDTDFSCGANQVMVGINFRNTNSDWTVDMAQIACAPLQ